MCSLVGGFGLDIAVHNFKFSDTDRIGSLWEYFGSNPISKLQSLYTTASDIGRQFDGLYLMRCYWRHNQVVCDLLQSMTPPVTSSSGKKMGRANCTLDLYFFTRIDPQVTWHCLEATSHALFFNLVTSSSFTFLFVYFLAWNLKCTMYADHTKLMFVCCLSSTFLICYNTNSLFAGLWSIQTWSLIQEHKKWLAIQ